MHHNSLVGIESAVVIWVPEADRILEGARSLCPTSMESGIAAHITVNYPFMVQDDDLESTVSRLSDSVRDLGTFEFRLTELRRWPTTLYLQPEPDAVFREIIAAVWRAFPESPPYGGRFDDVAPHLTIIESGDIGEIDILAPKVCMELAGKLPIAARAEELHLIAKIEHKWKTAASVHL